MKIEDDVVTFSSGRTRNANCGIIGLSRDGDDLTEGYDGGFWDPAESDPDFYRSLDKLSREDLAELADHMIALWQGWKARVTGSASHEQ